MTVSVETRRLDIGTFDFGRVGENLGGIMDRMAIPCDQPVVGNFQFKSVSLSSILAGNNRRVYAGNNGLWHKLPEAHRRKWERWYRQAAERGWVDKIKYPSVEILIDTLGLVEAAKIVGDNIEGEPRSHARTGASLSVVRWDRLKPWLRDKIARTFDYFKNHPDRIKNPETREKLETSQTAEEWVNQLNGGAADVIVEHAGPIAMQNTTTLALWAENGFERNETGQPVLDFSGTGEKEPVDDLLQIERIQLADILEIFGGDCSRLIEALVSEGMNSHLAESVFDAYEQAGDGSDIVQAPDPIRPQPAAVLEGFKINAPKIEITPLPITHVSEFIPGYTPIDPLEGLPICSYPIVKVDRAIPPSIKIPLPTVAEPSIKETPSPDIVQPMAIGTLADVAIKISTSGPFKIPTTTEHLLVRPMGTLKPSPTVGNAVGAIGGVLSIFSLVIHDKENRAAYHCMMNPYSLECGGGNL